MEYKETLKEKRFRSRAYPAISLDEALECVDKLRKNLGKGPYNREAVVKALGYGGVSGRSASVIAAMVHFGLLVREGNIYRQSPLTDRILFPLSDEDKNTAVTIAALTPKLFRNLVQRYSGSSLPNMLGSILYHDFKINEKVTHNVAENFKKSMEYSNILINGVIMSDVSNLEEKDEKVEAEAKNDLTKSVAPNRIGGSTLNKEETTAGFLTPMDLPSGIRILFPARMGYDLLQGKFAEVIKELEEAARQIGADLDNEG